MLMTHVSQNLIHTNRVSDRWLLRCCTAPCHQHWGKPLAGQTGIGVHIDASFLLLDMRPVSGPQKTWQAFEKRAKTCMCCVGQVLTVPEGAKDVGFVMFLSVRSHDTIYTEVPKTHLSNQG